jgi:hypothetical protein
MPVCLAVHGQMRRQKFVCRKTGIAHPVPCCIPRVVDRRREHRDRDRHLRHDQPGPDLPQSHARATARRNILEAGLHAPAGDFQCRHHANDRRCTNRERERVDKAARRERELHPEGKRSCNLRQRRIDFAQRERDDADADDGSHAGEDERFDEELRDNAPASGAERAANGDLGMPRRGACVNEDRNVDAHDTKQQRDDELHHAQRQRVLGLVHVGERIGVGHHLRA